LHSALYYLQWVVRSTITTPRRKSSHNIFPNSRFGPFANHTQQYGLEDKLTLAVQSEFNRDGRYQITAEENADGVVIGDITKYILEPLSYDTNHVPTEYKLWIWSTSRSTTK